MNDQQDNAMTPEPEVSEEQAAEAKPERFPNFLSWRRRFSGGCAATSVFWSVSWMKTSMNLTMTSRMISSSMTSRTWTRNFNREKA